MGVQEGQMASSPSRISLLLSDVSRPDDFSELIRLVYSDLRRMAAQHFRHERPGHTLQPTALVHELYVRLFAQRPKTFRGRAHFFGVASRAMREVLVEQARRRGAQKRGGGQLRVSLEDLQIACPEPPDYAAIDAALTQLTSLDARLADIVEFRVFGGLSTSEIAAVLHMGKSTVRKHWALARAWLERELGTL